MGDDGESNGGDKKKKKTKRTKSNGPTVDWMGNVIDGEADATLLLRASVSNEDSVDADDASLPQASVSIEGSEHSVSSRSSLHEDGVATPKVRSKSAKGGAAVNFSMGEATSIYSKNVNEAEALDEHLEFRPRHIPQVSFDWPGFIYYFFLLSFFLYYTLGGRDYAFYYTEYAREIADIEHFMKIDSSLKYQDWLETAFIPNLHYNSVNRTYAGAPGIVLIGPPRVRALRAKGAYVGSQPSDGTVPRPGQCGQAAEIDGLPVACFDLTSDEMATEAEQETIWFDSIAPWWSDGTVGEITGPESEPDVDEDAPGDDATAAAPITLEYVSGDELEEDVYSSCGSIMQLRRPALRSAIIPMSYRRDVLSLPECERACVWHVRYWNQLPVRRAHCQKYAHALPTGALGLCDGF